MLSLSLLGRVSLLNNGMPLHRFRSRKEAALLIYLAQTEKIHQRDFIAELFWDARSTQQALGNLRTVLARLRKQVGDDLLITRKTLALTPENWQQIDSLNLLRALTNIGQIDSAEKANALQSALDAYHGDFLADFYLPNAPRFTEWVAVTREHIRRQVIAAYHKLGAYMLSTADIEVGITVVRSWLQIDALDETANILLIQFLLKAGKTYEALAHYDHCVTLFRIELSIEPSPKMKAIIKDARPKRTLNAPLTAVRHNLPTPHDQFFGRKTAQQAIHTRLDQPWCRVVTIIGQGGVGKTRLATTLARNRLNQYSDGVWLVDLASLDPDDDNLAEAIAVETAITLDLRLSGSAKPAEQLLNYLQHKQILLVLDNFELLLAGTQVVLDIVKRCENVQILITSREPLRIRAEWTIALTGLGYFTGMMDKMPSEAVELFVARRAQRQRNIISADEMDAIHTICSLVEGLPLAIELAAALTHHSTLQSIADNLRDGFGILTSSMRDALPRHRNLSIVFEMSWRTLTSVLQLRLMRLTVFRGGFTETAVSQIAEVAPEHLVALREKSLLTYHDTLHRYTLHPVIRAYVSEKRFTADRVTQKHTRYYLTLFAQHAEPLQKSRPQDSIKTLEPEIRNLRRAWQMGLAQRKTGWLTAALTPLSIYYQLRGLAREGEAIMQTTLREAKTWDDEGLTLATRAGLERTRFQNRLGQYRAAMQTIESALKLAAQSTDRWAEGMAHVLWGESLWRQGEYELAKNKLNHALTIAHAIDATLLIGWCHHHLGIINDIQSQYDTAHEHLQQACAAWRTIDNAQTLSGSLNSLGLVRYHQGNLPAAQQAMGQALTLCNQLDDRHLQSMILNNLSIIAIEQSDYIGAQYYLQLSLKLATISGNLIGQGEIYTNLGRNYRWLGEMDLAVESLEQGLQISELIGDRNLTAKVMINLAEISQGQDDLERAESLYKKVLKVARQKKLQRIECEALIGMAELLSEIDEKQAWQSSVEAVELAKVVQSPQLLDRANAIFSYLDASVDVN